MVRRTVQLKDNYMEENNMVIEKVEVRRRLLSYRNELKEKMRSIEEEKKRISDACTTKEMTYLWHTSTQYAVLTAKWKVLQDVCSDIFNLRDEFDDEE